MLLRLRCEVSQRFGRIMLLILADVHLDHVNLVAASPGKADITLPTNLLGKAVVAVELLLQVAAREPLAR